MEHSIETIRAKLFTSVLSDTLDGLGYRNQAMRPAIRPLDESKTLVGRARTGFYMEVFHIAPDENPYDLEIRLIDDLKPGEVAVLGCGAAQTIAPWGELLSTACIARGAAGCITDGLVRDIRAIRKLGFPVFHGGIGPLDSKGRGKVMAIDVPIACGGVHVAPGDLLFGDADGVICVPQAIEEKAIAAALQKVEGEDRTREALARGEKLAQVFARYGIL
jgi:4-hydroxy-4-methyl-2-oxoglutarate aldolase